MASAEITAVSASSYASLIPMSGLVFFDDVVCIRPSDSVSEVNVAVLDPTSCTLKHIQKLFLPEPIRKLALEKTDLDDSYILLAVLDNAIIIYSITKATETIEVAQLANIEKESPSFLCFDKTSQLFVTYSKDLSLELYETLSGTLVSASIPVPFIETIQDATFSMVYPYILVAVHSENILSFWDMQKMALVNKIGIEGIPIKVHTNETGLIVITSMDGKIEGFNHHCVKEDGKIVVNKEFVIDTDMLAKGGVGNSFMLGSGKHLLIAGGANDCLDVIDLDLCEIAWKIEVELPEAEFLYTFSNQGKSGLTLFMVSEGKNSITAKTYKLPISEEVKEEEKSVPLNALTPEEEQEIEEQIFKESIEERAANNMYQQETPPSSGKKMWKSHSNLQALENTVPRPTSILIPANIQIKEKSIYDVDAKEIAKSKKKGAVPNLSVSTCFFRNSSQNRPSGNISHKNKVEWVWQSP